jgi:glycosyltransferase involved in cell wall biosynthesis
VSMIVKNEEKDIRNCLESIKDADEIVIVDTGSTDNTVEICREYTDKVYTDYKWNDSFCEARNVALHRMTADFVLIIDADEKLSTPIKHIKRLVNELWFRKYSGLFFTIQMEREIFESPRIFKNTREIYYVNDAHNVPTWNGSADELVKRLFRSNFVIESGYSAAHQTDPERTLRILQKTYEKNPDDSRTIYYLGREYINHNDIKKATELFEKYKEMKLNDVSLWDNELADNLYLLALCYTDEVVWKEIRWFKAIDNALWSHCVLPTSKDTCELLSKLFAQMPGSVDNAVRQQIHTVQFWERAAMNATDAGVLMRRK